MLPPSSQEVMEKDLRFFCLNLSFFSSRTQLFFLSGGVFLFFILNGVLEEYTFALLPNFEYGWFLTFVELLCFAIFSAFERWVKHELVFGHKASLLQHGALSVVITVARGLTNISLQYLNYPTQVIFKSMKLLIVMLSSFCLLRKTFSMRQFLSAFFLVSSAVFFSLGDYHFDSRGPGFLNSTQFRGLVIVMCSLLADALHSSQQERVLQGYHAAILETLLFSNLFAAVLCLLYLAVVDELFPSIAYCSMHPLTYVIFVVRAFVIYCGVFLFCCPC